MLFVPLSHRSEREENVCCNFNDVYLMMPELMSQQTIMVSAASNFHVPMQMMMRGLNQISVNLTKTATAIVSTVDWSAS